MEFLYLARITASAVGMELLMLASTAVGMEFLYLGRQPQSKNPVIASMSPVRALFFSFSILFTLFHGTSASAQTNKLDGVWEGTMVVGGLEGAERLPMQLYLKTKGRKVEGRSYVQLPDGSTLRMDLRGTYFRDGSMELLEVNFAGDPTNDLIPEFNRQYQIVLSDDIWDPILNGYWQEITEEVFKNNRRLGRMQLNRRLPDDA